MFQCATASVCVEVGGLEDEMCVKVGDVEETPVTAEVPGSTGPDGSSDSARVHSVRLLMLSTPRRPSRKYSLL